MGACFQVKKSKAGYRFNLCAANGQVILTSQSYKTRTSALNGIASIKKNAGKDASFERLKGRDGRAYFVIRAANKEIIGRSQMYASTSGCSNGIKSVRKNARGAKVMEAD